MHIQIHPHFSFFFLSVASDPLQWPVDPFQLRFPSRLKHLVTPLTADSPDLLKPSTLPLTCCHYLETTF